MQIPVRQDENVAETLRVHGVIPTAQRIEIGRMILSKPAHFSADQLYEEVKRAGGDVSKATVYNTLGLFVEKGLLRRVLVDPSKVFYDSNMCPHHHFYDVVTGELEDINADEIEISALPETNGDVCIEGIDVVVRIKRSQK